MSPVYTFLTELDVDYGSTILIHQKYNRVLHIRFVYVTCHQTWIFSYCDLDLIQIVLFGKLIYFLYTCFFFQTLTPHMQSPVEDLYKVKSSGRLMGPSLGDQLQGSFSINLWKSAFMDAFQRLCPVQAGGHECGCLTVLARMVRYVASHHWISTLVSFWHLVYSYPYF